MRCKWSDLETEHCAHCKGVVVPEVEEVDPMEGVRLKPMGGEKNNPRAFQAETPDTCSQCGNPIEVGDSIVGVLRDPYSWSDGFKSYRHEECP